MATDSSAVLLNESAARLAALQMVVSIMLINLVKSGALPAELFVKHLAQEASKMQPLDETPSELLALSQSARDRVFADITQLALRADAARPPAAR